MPSHHSSDWDDGSNQEWEPVVLKSRTRFFDPAFAASARSLRLALRLTAAGFAARAGVSEFTVVALEAGRLPYDTAVEHRVRALLMQANKNATQK